MWILLGLIRFTVRKDRDALPVTGAMLLMALAACIAVVRAGECMRAMEEMVGK